MWKGLGTRCNEKHGREKKRDGERECTVEDTNEIKREEEK